MKRLLLGLIALTLLVGCNGPSKAAQERAIEEVQVYRKTPNAMTVGTLLDVYIADLATRGQNVMGRDWSAERNGTTWTVGCTITTSGGSLLSEWTLDDRTGQVEPANELARTVDGYSKVALANHASPEASATPVPPAASPSASASLPPMPSASPSSLPPSPVESPSSEAPSPTVTVTVTASPSAAVPVEPPNSTPLSDIQLQGVMDLGGVPIALLSVKGQHYEGHVGDNIEGYRLVHIGDREVTFDDHGKSTIIHLAPSDGVPRFIPAPDASRAPMAPPPVVRPGEGPVEIPTK